MLFSVLSCGVRGQVDINTSVVAVPQEIVQEHCPDQGSSVEYVESHRPHFRRTWVQCSWSSPERIQNLLSISCLEPSAGGWQDVNREPSQIVFICNQSQTDGWVDRYLVVSPIQPNILRIYLREDDANAKVASGFEAFVAQVQLALN